MKIVPKPDQLKWLSKKDQAYWRGYFDGRMSARMQYDQRWQADRAMKAAMDEVFQKMAEADRDARSRNQK